MTAFDRAFQHVSELVRQFAANEEHYVSSRYQEAEVRADYIDKFWIALGWDVSHNIQTNPREQEVKVEKNPDSSASSRRADYAFYFHPDYRNPIFFCEAKKPSRTLGDPEFYFQLIRYGRAATTPVGVLTDFEEFHIVDCRYEANLQKSYPTAKIKDFRYTDYLDREKFGYVYWLFSREAIEAGKLKEFSKELPKYRGKGASRLTSEEARPTDEAFLTKLEEYRLTLAKAFKKSDGSMSAEELTEATQKVIDRLVFIRFLEDKNIEEDYIVDLIAAKGSNGGAWKSFVAWSRELDVKYNGVVFKPHAIDRPGFQAPDDKVFSDLCADISHSRSKYIFSYIPIELLGSIYERFLGKIVTVTAKRADIEYKPEVRKAGGVYYTPKYIVDYIIANTVGNLLEGKTPKQIGALRFADIACGSGSFLIAVYDSVLRHVESYYNQHPDEARKSGCHEIDKGIFALSLKQKQQILLDNVFGVDIDSQAVEVAQLSLFLKLLEGESGASTGQLSFEKTKILPDLSRNVVCGNSLVDYDIASLFPLAPEEEERIKPFNFETQFKGVLRGNGFDVIVGNPPYRMLQPHNTSEELLAYLRSKYFAADFKVDFFHLFLQRATTLLRNDGSLGYIVPSTLLANFYVEKLRRWITDNATLDTIAVQTEPVFSGADVHTCILILRASRDKAIHDTSSRDHLTQVTISTNEELRDRTETYETIRQARLNQFQGTVWNVLVNESNAGLIEKAEASGRRFSDVSRINRGLITGDRGKYFSRFRETPDHVPILTGGDVFRYRLNEPSEFVLFKRPKTSGGCWDPEVHLAEHKVVVRQIGVRPTASYLTEPTAVTGNIFTILHRTPEDELYLLGLLNSTFISYYWQRMFADFKTSFPQVSIFSLGQVPLPDVAESKSKDLIAHVQKMLDATARQAAARKDSERDQLQRKCEYLDGEIDLLVYDLYGLTDEEIRMVEGN